MCKFRKAGTGIMLRVLGSAKKIEIFAQDFFDTEYQGGMYGKNINRRFSVSGQ